MGVAGSERWSDADRLQAGSYVGEKSGAGKMEKPRLEGRGFKRIE